MHSKLQVNVVMHSKLQVNIPIYGNINDYETIHNDT